MINSYRTIDSKALKHAKKFLYYRQNPIAFIENCVHIPTPGGDELLKLYAPQKRVLKSFFVDHYQVLLKSRQTGFSTLSQAIVTYIATFYENCVIGIVSKSGDESSDFTRKVEDMIDKLPDWIRPTYKQKSTQFFILKTGTQLHAAAIPQANPGSVLRGKSIVLLIIDEAAHIAKIDEAWTGIAPALQKAQQSANKNGIPFGTIILSTPNKTAGIGQWYFNQWKKAKGGASIFKAHRIYWKEIPDYVNDPNWYKTQCDLLDNRPEKIAQELELQFVGAESTLFDEKIQRALQQARARPIEIIRIRVGGELWRFDKLDPFKFYLIGVDTASAAGTDFSAIEVFDYQKMKQVLEFKGKLEPKKFAEVVKIVSQLVPHNTIIVENSGGYGIAVLNELQFDENRKYNVFGEWRGATRGGQKRSNSKEKRFIPGLATTGKSRPLILDALYEHVVGDPGSIRSERLALELLTLVNVRGKIEADKGFNDDLSFALGFLCYARKYGAHLLGNTEELENQDSIIFNSAGEVSKIFHGLNNDINPLKGNYENAKSFDHFKKDLDKYIKEHLGTTLQGTVDITKLWSK